MNYMRWIIPSLIFLISAWQYGFFNSYLPLTDPVETNYALTAKEMLLSNNWLSPSIYGHTWYDKPPLTYWALILSYKLFGINDWAARFPSLISSSLSILAMYFIGKKFQGQGIFGVVSAFVLATCLQFWYIGHAVLTDGFLFLFSLGIFYFAYEGIVTHHKRSMIGAYICAAGAVLAKGPIGILLPGLALFIFLALQIYQMPKPLQGNLHVFKLLFPPIGIALFAIITGPWYYMMFQMHGADFINGFFGMQNLTRALVAEHPKFNVWYYYLLLIPIACIPWTPILVWQLIHTNWKNRKNQYGAIWFIIIVLFYSLVATKYITYTFIALIPLILWTSLGCIRLRSQKFANQRRLRNTLLYIPCITYACILMMLPSVLTPSPILFDINGWKIPAAIIYLLFSLALITLAIMSRGFTNHPKLIALFWTASAVGVFTILTVTIPPTLKQANGSDALPIVQTHPNNSYIYNTYYTSIVYYGNVTPTMIVANSSDDKRWTQAKTLMPHITERQLSRELKRTHKQIVIVVPHKFYPDFYMSNLYDLVELKESTDNNYIFMTK